MKHKIAFSSNYGSFAYRLTAEIEAAEPIGASAEYLWQQGLANIAYRAAGSAVDKELGVKGKTPVYDKRGDVPYNESNSGRINAAVEEALDKLAEKEPAIADLDLRFAVTGQYEPSSGGASAMVRATLFIDSALAGSPAARMLLEQMLGLAEGASRDELIAAAHAKRLGIDPPRKAKTAKAAKPEAGEDETNGESSESEETASDAGEESEA